MVSRPKKYLCSFEGCEKAYNRPALLRQHERTHTNDRPFKCLVDGCDKSFFRKSHLKVHQHSHQDDDEKPFKCLICGKGAISPQLLQRHELTHTKKYKCDYEDCSQAFYHYQSLKHHVDIDHKQILTCDKCNRRFQRPVLLAEHKAKHHGETMEVEQCDLPGCFLTFKSLAKLAEHKRKEHPKLKCDECGEICVGERAMKTHRIIHGDKATTLEKCDLCDGGFVSHDDLVRHQTEVHKDANAKIIANGDLDVSAVKPSSLKSMLRDPDFNADVDEEDIQKPVRGRPKSAKEPSEVSFDSLGSVIDIVLGNVTKTYVCPRERCKRKFVRHHAYLKHLRWHKVQVQKAEAYLKSLEENDEESLSELDNFTDYSDSEDMFQDARMTMPGMDEDTNEENTAEKGASVENNDVEDANEENASVMDTKEEDMNVEEAIELAEDTNLEDMEEPETSPNIVSRNVPSISSEETSEATSESVASNIFVEKDSSPGTEELAKKQLELDDLLSMELEKLDLIPDE